LGVSTRERLGSVDVCTELKECKTAFSGDRAPTDPSLRRRLSRAVDEIAARANTAEILDAAWSDLERRALAAEDAEPEARHLLSLAAWLGHDVESLTNAVTRELTGPEAIRAAGALFPPQPDDIRTLQERFDQIRALLQIPPWRAETIVWLRFRLAKVDWPDAGLPVIEIGNQVCIYDSNWLRGCMSHPQPHHNLPPEILNADNWMLRSFYGVTNDDPSFVDDPPESPVAYIRIVLDDELGAHAVEIARSNAEAIAALGALRGTASDVWRLDESYVMLAHGREGGSSAPASVEEPTWTERRAVLEDRTSRIIRELAEQLSGHVPIRDPEMERAATLLGWLRGARLSPAPLRLVLCDRVVEAVCGWAGIAKPDDFARQHLIPWWAYARMRETIANAAMTLFWSRRPGDPNAEIWDEILAHEPLEIRQHPLTMSLRGVVTEVDWLLARVPEDGPLRKDLLALKRRTVTGQATNRWWDETCVHATRIERRRQRTRNALMHGGPQTPATVDSVVAFAEHIAVDALYASLEGKLLGQDLIDYFLDRRKQVADMRSRLRRGDPPGDVLFDRTS
jgi:hypothetical protein